MNTKLILVILFTTVFSMTMKAQHSNSKTLIVYYSWSGNTREIANQIQSLTGAEVFEIIPEKPYSDDYKTCVEQARKDVKEGVKPALKTNIKDLAQYDIILIGSPNWCSTIAPPVATFLAQNNLSGKIVAPFITHGGGGIANCETDIKKLCPNATVKDYLVVPGSSVKSAQKEVSDWLNDLHIK